MKYAVITTGGKQYKVAEGDTIAVEKLNLKEGDKHTFESVLLIVDGDKRQVGTPTVKGATVAVSVIGEKKTPKIRVAKFKAKAKYRRVTGHRSVMTHVKIEKIAEK